MSAMNKKKRYNQVVKRILRPEVTHCLTCQSKLKRCVTITDRMIITFTQVLRVVHCGYRCPQEACEGRSILYRSREADALALSGFTFGLDIVLQVGHLRLREHQTVDEIHQHLSERLALLEQTISRREILFLFEAYTALLRAGTEVSQDEQWKEQARKNHGILLSIDGIQPDAGNETIYLVRDVLTGRILTAENTTDSTTQRLKQILAPVLALHLPVLGVISDAQKSELQAVAQLWPGVPHQICQFHAMRDASRLIFQADTRVRNDLRAGMKQKSREYRQTLHKRIQEADAQDDKKEQEIKQLHILEEYAAMVTGALQTESQAPFQYGGLAMQQALIQIQESVEKLEKKERP
jgi:transposase